MVDADTGAAQSPAEKNNPKTKVTSELEKLSWTRKEVRIAGSSPKSWMVRPDITPEERAQGFRVCDPAQAPESSGTQVANELNEDDLL